MAPDCTQGEKKHSKVPFRNQELFLVQKIEVAVTARSGIDDGGKGPWKNRKRYR